MVNKPLPTLRVMVYDTIWVEEVILHKFVLICTVGVTLEEYKKALGPLARELTEDEIQRAFTLSERMAGVLFDMWRDAGKVK